MWEQWRGCGRSRGLGYWARENEISTAYTVPVLIVAVQFSFYRTSQTESPRFCYPYFYAYYEPYSPGMPEGNFNTIQYKRARGRGFMNYMVEERQSPNDVIFDTRRLMPLSDDYHSIVKVTVTASDELKL